MRIITEYDRVMMLQSNPPEKTKYWVVSLPDNEVIREGEWYAPEIQCMSFRGLEPGTYQIVMKARKKYTNRKIIVR
jgi:hypothetical protein